MPILAGARCAGGPPSHRLAVGRGHAGDPGNERADALANRGIDEIQGKSRRIPAMRQIFLDTETTGLETRLGHRIIELACVEMRTGA